MTDTNSNYYRLAKHLNKTRKSLQQACSELAINYDVVNDMDLEEHVQECCNCSIWGTKHKRDLDDFPICDICLKLVGA